MGYADSHVIFQILLNSELHLRRKAGHMKQIPSAPHLVVVPQPWTWVTITAFKNFLDRNPPFFAVEDLQFPSRRPPQTKQCKPFPQEWVGKCPMRLVLCLL